MRTLLVVLLAVVSCALYAQETDYPDFRSKKDNFTKVREKDVRSDLAVFTMAGIEESIGKLPLKTIPVTKFGDNFIHFEGGDIQVTITSGTFDKARHKLTFSEEHLVKIDGKPFYGNYGKVPVKTIESISVLVGKDTVAIPSTAYFDLYNPKFTYTDAGGTAKSYNGVHLSADGRNIYIYLLTREALGGYEVTWVIQDKKYLRRVVDFNILR